MMNRFRLAILGAVAVCGLIFLSPDRAQAQWGFSIGIGGRHFQFYHHGHPGYGYYPPAFAGPPVPAYGYHSHFRGPRDFLYDGGPGYPGGYYGPAPYPYYAPGPRPWHW